MPTMSVLFLCLGVTGCLIGSAPAAQMCYNSNVTFDTTGYAVVSAATPLQTCRCTMMSSEKPLQVEVTLSTSQSSCGNQIMDFVFSSGFSTLLDCRHGFNQRTIGVSASKIQPITYKRFQPVDICVKFQVLSGQGKLRIQCSGDELPLTTQTPAPITTKSTRLTPQPTTTTTTTTMAQSMPSPRTTTFIPSPTSKPTTITPAPITTKSTRLIPPPTTMTTTAAQSMPSPTTTTYIPTPTSKPTTITQRPTTEKGTKPTQVISTGGLNMTTTPQNSTEILTTFYSKNETDSNTTTTEVAGKTSGEAASTESPETMTTVQHSSPGADPEKDPENLDGVIAGVVVASIVFVILVALLIFLLERRRRAKKLKKLYATTTVGATENPAYDDVTSEGYSSIADAKKKRSTYDVETNKENGNVSQPPEEIKHEEKASPDVYATVNKKNKEELENADTLF